MDSAQAIADASLSAHCFPPDVFLDPGTPGPNPGLYRPVSALSVLLPLAFYFPVVEFSSSQGGKGGLDVPCPMKMVSKPFVNVPAFHFGVLGSS